VKTRLQFKLATKKQARLRMALAALLYLWAPFAAGWLIGGAL